MASETIVDAVEQQQWLEPVEAGLQKAVATAYEATGPAGRVVKNFLHGTWLGHPLHPVLTDVPIGAWSAALVLDAMEAGGNRRCGRAADTVLSIGLAGAVGAALAGLTDWQATDGSARRVGVTHGLLNLTSATLYTASLVARKQRHRGAGRWLAAVGFAVSAAAAWLGGNLVYGKQIGVNHTAGEPLPHDWTPAVAESDLREGKPRRAEVNGVKLLMLRRAGQIYCIAEVCSHLVGPLADGEIHEDTVTCPWHASCFSLRDGSVIDGPATHPQPCFEARVRNGQIEVRARQQE